MKKLCLILLVAGTILILLRGFLWLRWRHLWQPEPLLPVYESVRHTDDTLRVVMIGDSWAGMHREGGLDTLLQHCLEEAQSRPVQVVSNGKGGAVSRVVYQLMSERGDDGTRKILENGPDYCIISVGINDAAKCLGPQQFVVHYRLIVDQLLQMGICPVVLEMPDVDLRHAYKGKPLRHRLGEYLKMWMVDCRPYTFAPYREKLKTMLLKQGWKERVVYVSAGEWNNQSVVMTPGLFLPDRIHLNTVGYARLDSCIAVAIAQCESEKVRRLNAQ